MLRKILFSMIALIMVLSVSASPVYANGSYGSSNLFDFYSNSKKSKTNIDKESMYTDPISNVADTDKGEVKRVIVRTTKPISQHKQKQLLGQYGVYNKSLVSVRGFSAYIPEKNIPILERNSLIKDIVTDSVVYGLGDAPSINKIVSSDQVFNNKNLTGEGIGVAILDTGIYPHSDVISNEYNIVAFKDFINSGTEPYDDNGHGTHVAGLVTGDGLASNGKYKGVSPNVNLVIAKVLDEHENGTDIGVINAIDWVLANKDKHNIRIMNLSLGMPFQGYEDPLMEAVEKATAEGILVVVAAGNTGNNGEVMSPAVSPSVLSVGGTNTNGTVEQDDDTLAWFSPKVQTINNVQKPEIFAPGENLISLIAYNSTYTRNYPQQIVETDYYRSSGTSMAAPVVSGAAALLFEDNPNITPMQAKNKLISNSLSVSNMDMLNVASLFNLEPTWNEGSTDDGSTDDGSTDDGGTDDGGTDEGGTDEGGTDDGGTDEGGTDNGGTDEGGTDNGGTDEGGTDNGGSEEGGTEEGNNGGNNNQEPQKPDANVPDENYNTTGKDFVEKVYNQYNILEKLVEKKEDYNNPQEIEMEYDNVEDVVKLFNIINRSFTRQDFLYFQHRLDN